MGSGNQAQTLTISVYIDMNVVSGEFNLFIGKFNEFS